MLQTGSHAGVLGGARVLIVEDNVLIAADLDLIVEDAGGRTVALAGTAEQALQVLSGQGIDAALVEYKLREGHADALVEGLSRRGLPFVIYTGLPVCAEFQRRFPNARWIEKPAYPEALVRALGAALIAACPAAA